MTRTFSIGSALSARQAGRHRLGEVEPPLVERPPRDRPVERRAALLQRPQVGRCEATPPEAITGTATARASAAVAGDVRARPSPRRGRCRCRRSRPRPRPRTRRARSTRVDVGRLGPALDRDPAVARVDADRDPPGMRARRRPHQAGVAQRGGAEDHPRDARAPASASMRRAVADAAAELHRHRDRGEDRLDRRAVDRRPAKAPFRSTRCSQRQPAAAKARACAAGSSPKTVAPVHVAAQQPHAGAVLEVDGGVEDHRRLIARAWARGRKPPALHASAAAPPWRRRH